MPRKSPCGLMTQRMGAATPTWAVVFLLALTLVAGLAAASVYQFYDGVSDPPPSYPSGGNGVVVFSNSWAAQSFEASANYTLARVDLWATANGAANNSATLEVRLDSAGVPDMVGPRLAAATATAPASYGWVSFNVAPNVVLTRGRMYWVVLESNGTGGSRGWTWWNTGNDTFINPGEGEVSSSLGTSWGSAGGDFAVRTFGYMETHVQIAMTVDYPQARAGEVVTFALFFNNTGGVEAAQVWINETLPAGLAYFSDNASASQGIASRIGNWTFLRVEPGSHYFFLKASIDSSAANQSLLVNRVTLAYTDFRGSPMSGSTAAVTLTVTGALGGSGGIGDLVSYAMFAAVIAWILFAGLWPRGRLEEVFLVDNGGTLVAHLSRTDDGQVDHDIFAGMLTAVQAFVRDSFASAKEGELKRMDFGMRKIYLWRGTHSYLAAVLKGRTPPTLGRKLRNTLERIEQAYGDVLASWGGDMRQVEGTVQILSSSLLG